MRVVSGTAGGIPLTFPKGGALRPTMDMVKGAIFSSLAGALPGSRVLDLFAGTGALGIEALSRGAREAVFVDSDRRAVASIHANLAKTKLTGKVMEIDVFSYLDRLAVAGSFDLIFADPPYARQESDRNFSSQLLASESLHAALTLGGLFILEHLPGDDLELDRRWNCLRDKRYGATAVAFFNASSPAPSSDVTRNQPEEC